MLMFTAFSITLFLFLALFFYYSLSEPKIESNDLKLKQPDAPKVKTASKKPIAKTRPKIRSKK